jgi:hypothetical protein
MRRSDVARHGRAQKKPASAVVLQTADADGLSRDGGAVEVERGRFHQHRLWMRLADRIAKLRGIIDHDHLVAGGIQMLVRIRLDLLRRTVLPGYY